MEQDYEFETSFVRISRETPAILRVNEASDRKETGILFMHSNSDYLDVAPAVGMAKLGYTTLAANPPNGLLEEKMTALGKCVSFVRGLPWIRRVIIFGHSGGATLASAYQAAAENGVSCLQSPDMFYQCQDIDPLPEADVMLFVDSNWGNGMMTLMSLDPNVSMDGKYHPDEGLDLFSPDHGYSPEGSRYEEKFVRNFLNAQGEAMNRLVEYALDRLTLIREGKGRYNDDEPFVVPGSSQMGPNNKLFPEDRRYLCRTRNKFELVHPDGERTTEIIYSLHRPEPGFGSFNSDMLWIATNTTVKQFLSNSAVWTNGFYYDDSVVYGVDYSRGISCTPGNVQHIHVPSLVVGLTGGYECIASELVYHSLASEDKQIGFIEGASHNFIPEAGSEDYSGQFKDTVMTLCRYIDEWLCKKKNF